MQMYVCFTAVLSLRVQQRAHLTKQQPRCRHRPCPTVIKYHMKIELTTSTNSGTSLGMCCSSGGLGPCGLCFFDGDGAFAAADVSCCCCCFDLPF